VLAKEGYSQILLKTLHLQADGRWCASKTVCRLRETTNIMRRDEGPQGVEIEITQKHPALMLQELRRGSSPSIMAYIQGEGRSPGQPAVLRRPDSQIQNPMSSVLRKPVALARRSTNRQI
jgi:hypothetical protein